MLSGFPDRPITRQELDRLVASDALEFVLPATPESIHVDDEGNESIHDLLVFIDGPVAAVAYDEDSDGWIVVTKESGDDPLDLVFESLLEYRDYEIEQEEAVREITEEIHGIISKLADIDMDDIEE
jgi:hypothetical protein